jgi:hypothetical protein
VNLSLRDDESEVFDRGHFKFTLIMSQEQLVFMKLFKDDSCDLAVLLDRLCENEDIVQIDADYAFHN